ncbi:MAG: succinate dehydrogenase [Bacteroidetes bacterium]|nr:succinate dehydrogenase [Bacteroidota bacterium]
MKTSSFRSTFRTDKWWIEPLLILSGLAAFVLYASWAGYQGNYYWWSNHEHGFGGYLSPFYSPLLWIKEGVEGGADIAHAWLGPWPGWWPNSILLPESPSLLILVFPLSIRFTCYYYRKAYYRAFAGSPPACAVGAIPQKSYKGETGLMIFQNIHRYTLYIGIIFIFLLSYDAVLSFFRGGQFGIGVGSMVLLINPILLGSWTFGCHAFRHLVGGNSNCMSCSLVRYQTYKKVSWLNSHHQLFAWCSLFWVGFSDFYVRMVSMGVFNDINTW